MTIGAKYKFSFSDIRIWIFAFFILRLVGITNPPLETGHNWRQSLTNMVSRNFLENEPNLLYPQIDMAGDLTGIIGSEFPFFNYLIYLVSSIFGYSHWYGRLINLVVSSIGIYFFYRLAEKLSSKKIGFSASIILLASGWFSFSRKIMPDTFSVSLVLIGLYYCYDFICSGKWWKLLLFFVFNTLGILCKIPALSLIGFLSTFFLIKDVPVSRKIWVMVFSCISICIMAWWYFYWVPYLLATYHYQLYFTKGLLEGYQEILGYKARFLEKFYFSALHSYTALVFFLIGIYFFIKDKNRSLKIGFVVITITFFIFILKTGAVFPLHNYYIIPFTPIMAIIAGYGVSRFPNKYLFIPLIAIVIEGIANQNHDFFIKKSEWYKVSLEEITAKNIPTGDLIIINGGQSPQEIYFSHRKGWTVGNDALTKDSLEYFQNKGASFLIINTRKYDQPIEYYPAIYSDKNYSIYKIKSF